MDTTLAAVSASLGQKALFTDINLQNEFRIYSSSQSNALTIKKDNYAGFKLTFDPTLLTSCLTMNNCQGSGGCFRAVAPSVDLEASIGFYKYTDLRGTSQGDTWVCGLNSWGTPGYSIGTSVTGVCLNIHDNGVVDVPFVLTTQELMTDTIRGQTAEFINIDDNVVITGSLTVNGYLETGATVDRNPFWVAGKVNGSNGAIITNKGRVGFSVGKSATGFYVITMDYPHPDGSEYIIHTTAQTYHSYVRTGGGYDPTNNQFTIIVINSSNVTSDITFFFSVLA
jgi:hypothetical protein